MSQPQDHGSPLKSQFAADPEMAELVGLFVSELPARVEAMRRAWASREVNVLTRLTHQLKGAGAGYGFPTIGSAAGAVEGGLRGLASDGAHAELARLEREFQELLRLCSRACSRR